ncbi:MAG TPA: hypothetical protein DCZ94_12805 [Lentisphaeria bacterium]|nr:MAG: hypothetical protein A2X48_11005 [Lentisphaerae bacterium GWF2_49_21]HBC87827.1 hypothetical protein [Lentisphaeria bacterium]
MNSELTGYEYEILERHGTGRLGEELYIGFDPNLNHQVMIRMLPVSMISDAETYQRFMQGAKLTAALQHPNILVAYKAGECEDGNIFLVTRFEEGLFLNDYLTKYGKLSEAEAVNLIIPIADALNYAWESKKIIHRNICPETILISKDDRPLLTDFGIAKSRDAGMTETLKGVIMGNPQYMSPEQVRADRQLDFQSDMYCLGLVFYEILAGHPAFNQDTPAKLMEMQENRKPLDIKLKAPWISNRCAKAINRMLEKKKNKRYATWTELMVELKKLNGTMEATSELNMTDLTASRMKISSPGGKIREFATMMLTKLKKNGV